MMGILTLQRRARELGRIRIGQVVRGSNGKTRPEKLDRFRLTSSSQTLIETVARLYGGEVKPWQPQGGGPAGFEVVTESVRLPVLVPPQPVSQHFELWSGGGCQRRCDGVTNLINDSPCVCSPDPEDRECKPTTRLNVVLRDVEGIGVWRLETHGYHAAAELPEAAEFLAQARGYISGHLALEERVAKKNGQTKRFMVPTLEVDITPAALLSGQTPNVPQAAVGAAHIDAPALPAGSSGEVPAQRPAPPAELAVPPPPTGALSPAPSPSLTRERIEAAATLDELRELWRDAKGPKSDDVKAAFTARVAVLNAEVESTPTDNADEMWSRILRTVPSSWTTGQVETDFEAVTGVEPGEAGAGHMREYLDALAVEESA